MKQCPKCSVTYANDKQKFCTKDGTPLVDAVDASSGQGETVRIDSAQLDDEITKVISQPLPQMTGSAFDPYKTQVSTPADKAAPPPAPSQPIAPPPAVAPPPVSPPAPSPPEPPPPIQLAAPTPPAAPPPAAPPVSAPPPPAQEPPTPTQPPSAAAPAPPAAPTNTANIGSAQATNTSIAADTVSGVAVPPPPQTAPAAPVATATPQPPPSAKKRSKLPLILGILFVLFVIGAGAAVAGYFFVAKPLLDKKRVAALEPRRPEPTPIVVSTPEVNNPKPEAPKIEVPPYSPPAGAVQFVNSNAKLDGKLAEHYVDFSFYYPKTWQKDPKAGVSGASNFAKVERRLPPDFTQENFAVGWYSSTGSAETDQTVFPTLVDNLSKQFANSFAEYKKVSEGPTKAGVYDGYEFRFESVSRNTEHGDIKIWGRVIFVPPTDGSNNGVTLLMLTTSLAPELRSVDDVGVRGDLPMMLESFRFGK